MISKEKIVEKALELVSRYGVRMTSMDDLSRELGISKKTIYQLYTEKEELVSDCVKQIADDLDKITTEWMMKPDHPVRNIAAIYAECIKFILTYPPSFFYDLRKYYSKAYETLTSFRNELIENKVIKLLRQAREDGYLREEIDIRFLCEVYFFKFLELVDSPPVRQMYSFDQICNHLVNINLRGIMRKEYADVLDSIPGSAVS